MTGRSLHLASTAEGNELLARDPLALLLGMLLDQQIPMEKAFTSPEVLRARLGVERLDARELAAHDPEALEEIFRTAPALHRFPAAFAKRAQALAQQLVDEFDGDPENVWKGAADGTDLVKRIGTLPGFGEQKAKIFAALLGKQFGVRPEGWREAAGDYGKDGHRSIADVIDDDSRKAVRSYKQQMKAAAKANG